MSQLTSNQQGGFAIACRFEEFDAFEEAVGGWDLDFRQLDHGSFEAQLGQVATPSVLLTRCALSRKIEQRGAPPEGFFTFGIPAADGVPVRWRGKDLTGRHLMLFPAGQELDAISMPGFDVYTVSISEAAMVEAAARRGLASVIEMIPATDAIECAPELRETIRRQAERISVAAAVQPGLLHSPAFRFELEHDLTESVVDAISAGLASGSRPMARTRSRVLKRALEIITERADEPVALTEVQRQSGGSIRTMRYAFEEAYGISPKQYLQAYRLNQVHRALRNPGGEIACVSDAANVWGFWHMGQFAKDYRRMFGELPSDTYRRNARPTGSPGD